MAALGNNVKMAFLKGLEALGKGASNMATNAHQKLNEINLETRRRELLSEIPVRALDLWQQGEPMPQPLGDMLSELSALDEQLTVLRAQRYARVETEAEESAAASEELSGQASMLKSLVGKFKLVNVGTVYRETPSSDYDYDFEAPTAVSSSSYSDKY